MCDSKQLSWCLRSAACGGDPARRAVFGPVPPPRCFPSERVRERCFHRVYTMAKIQHDSKIFLHGLSSPQHHSIRPQQLPQPNMMETPLVPAHSSRIMGGSDSKAGEQDSCFNCAMRRPIARDNALEAAAQPTGSHGSRGKSIHARNYLNCACTCLAIVKSWMLDVPS